MITSKNIVKHELIGLKVSVVDSKNPSNKGIDGIVIDETRNTLVIETKKGEKRLVKEQCVFVFELPDGKRVKVDGKLLVSKPENRIKKKYKTW